MFYNNVFLFIYLTEVLNLDTIRKDKLKCLVPERFGKDKYPYISVSGSLLSRNSQKSYPEHSLNTEALQSGWDESFREHILALLGKKDSCPRIYTCQGRKTFPISAKQMFQTQFFPFTR